MYFYKSSLFSSLCTPAFFSEESDRSREKLSEDVAKAEKKVAV
jgi:hypothetical protein